MLLGWEALKPVGPLFHSGCLFLIHLSGELLPHKIPSLSLPLPLAVFLAFDILQDFLLSLREYIYSWNNCIIYIYCSQRIKRDQEYIRHRI